MKGTLNNTSQNGSRLALPIASSRRWQPLRGGLLNLYLYDYEEFRYERGRLILRGNNGTGKSRVLALQLPFLFDGRCGSHRVEPDADPAKRMEWNLLMDRHQERLGYTWIEFGKSTPQENGSANGYAHSSLAPPSGNGASGVHEPHAQHYVTLGCGLSATKGSGLREPWFFVTDQRIGQDLFLQTPTGQPLSKSALVEALGDRGSLFTTAKDYRQAVDDRLFGLGRQRYDAMVDLLIQLRKPQLSRNLDEKTLARVLGDALPPPSEQMIGDVAESFRGLEADRLELGRFCSARDGVDAFLKTYRRYAQVASRRRAGAVRQSQSRFETASRELRQAERDHTEAATLVERTTGQVRAIEVREGELDARIEALKADPKMRSAEAIQEAITAEQQAQEDLQTADADVSGADERRGGRATAQVAARTEAEAKLKNATDVLERSAALAANCALHEQHANALAGLNLKPAKAEEPLGGDPRAARRAIEDAWAKRSRSAEQLRAGHQTLQNAQRELALATTERDDAQQRVEQAILEQTAAEEQRHSCVEDFLEAYQMWRRDSDELQLPAETELAQEFVDWSRQIATSSPVTRILHPAEQRARDAVKAEQLQIQSRRDALALQQTALQSQLNQLESGFQQPPLMPPLVDESSRSVRPGAPFWSLVEFAEACSDADRAAVEASLEAAGILNAWVTPDGTVLTADFQDVLVIPDDARPAETLAKVIRPAAGESIPVPREVVAAILGCIGFGEQDCATWLTAQGHWRNGPVRGHANKPFAQYVGDEAREQQRLRSIASTRTTLSDLEGQLQQLHSELDVLTGRLRTIAKQVAAVPSDAAVREAAATMDVAMHSLLMCRKTLTDREQAVAERRRQSDAARQKLELDARDLGLAEWALRAEELLRNLASYRQQLAELWPLIDHCQTLKTQYATASTALQEADESLRLAQERQHEMRVRHSKADERLKTLRAAVGSDAEGILRELTAAEGAKATLLTELKQARTKETEAHVECGKTGERIQSRQHSVNQETESRLQHCTAFQRLCTLGLLQVATAEPLEDVADQWSLTRTLDVCRQTESTFAQVNDDDAAWDRVQQSVTATIQELNTALSQQAFTSTLTTTDELYCVTVPYQGRDQSVQDLRTLLSEEVEQRQRILDEREREIIENHLIGEVAAKLHEQIHEAHALVERMNAEILQRPMSTGMTLKFAWKPDDENQSRGMVEMCKKLLAATGTWSPSERAAVGQYLQEHVKHVRDSRQVGTWHDHLAEALDYRSWHRFWVLRKQEAGWLKLTKRTHGTGSGGEKAVALTIPQFAAAAAHYSSARPDAPRLILLDEAFVGIDPDMRGKCMELINVFDLDFLLTSESEWGCYPGLPGVAIHQLSTRSGCEAVFLTRWIWNGKQRLRDDAPLPPAALQEH